MGLSRSEQLVLVLLSIAILAGRAARGCGERNEFELIRGVSDEDSAGARSAAHESLRTGAEQALSASAVSADSARVVGARIVGAHDSTTAGPRAHVAQGARQAVNAAQAIDLNRATLEELVTLPGIGPAKAKAILERREAVNGFRSIDDLLDVPGIGPKTLEQLAGLVRVNAAPEEKR